MLPHPDSAVARWGGSAPRAAWAALVLVVVAAASGCATYTDSLARASLAAAGGDYPSAVGAVNQVIGVGSADQLPDRWGGSRALAVLERGVLQQALAAYDVSARDLSAAEQELELLDLKLDPVGTLGSYLYSDSVKTYKTPPTERLAVNACRPLIQETAPVGDPQNVLAIDLVVQRVEAKFGRSLRFGVQRILQLSNRFRSS